MCSIASPKFRRQSPKKTSGKKPWYSVLDSLRSWNWYSVFCLAMCSIASPKSISDNLRRRRLERSRDIAFLIHWDWLNNCAPYMMHKHLVELGPFNKLFINNDGIMIMTMLNNLMFHDHVCADFCSCKFKKWPSQPAWLSDKPDLQYLFGVKSSFVILFVERGDIWALVAILSFSST